MSQNDATQEYVQHVAYHQPKRSGFLMGWAIVCLVAGQIAALGGIQESMSGGMFNTPNPGPWFVVALLLGITGIVLVLTSYSRLAANVEYVAMAEYQRRHESATRDTAPPMNTSADAEGEPLTGG